MSDVLLVVVVAVALGFDFTNGFHDTANSIATAIGSPAFTPPTAVAIAAVANLGGAFMTTAVAKTVAKGIIDAHLATQQAILAALIGATAWNLITWWLGLPSSSSHALIGGLVGAAPSSPASRASISVPAIPPASRLLTASRRSSASVFAIPLPSSLQSTEPRRRPGQSELNETAAVQPRLAGTKPWRLERNQTVAPSAKTCR